MVKKVLIITYYWPPAGGGGVQRWLKFVKYLPQFGVKPVVVIPENPEYPSIDESLFNDVPDAIEIIKIPITEPYTWFKLLTGKKKNETVNSGVIANHKKQGLVEKISIWIRGNFFIPDSRMFWIKPASKVLHGYLLKNNIDTIITTGPPHSLHLIGLRIKQKHSVNWLADFRDPWSEIDYLEEFNPGKRAMQKHRKLEHKVLTKADKIITVSNQWANDLERLGAPRVSVITNGFDAADFTNFNYNQTSDKFILLYSGMLHAYRNPKNLWDVLDRLCNEHPDFAQNFQLQFYGNIDAEIISYLDALPNLATRYHLGGYIGHAELLKKYEAAAVLLLIQNDTKNALGHIPGKVFEYLAVRKFILGIGPKNGDVAKIIENCRAGKMFEKAEQTEIFNYLSELVQKWKVKQTLFDTNYTIDKYTRENLTRKIAQLL